MDLGLDFSQLNLSSDPDGITPSEIVSVLSNEKSKLREIEGYPREEFYSIETGYSNKKRILLIASRLMREKRELLQIKVADEDELQQYYCEG